MQVTAKIKGKTYDLRSISYNFGRNPSNEGAPSGKIIYGEVTFSFNASADELIGDTTFHEFISKEKNRETVTVDFLNSEEISKRNIKITNAAIVNLSESFNGTDTTVTVTVCSPDIKIGGKIIVNGNWT